jgi:hypothetical protein
MPIAAFITCFHYIMVTVFPHGLSESTEVNLLWNLTTGTRSKPKTLSTPRQKTRATKALKTGNKLTWLQAAHTFFSTRFEALDVSVEHSLRYTSSMFIVGPHVWTGEKDKKRHTSSHILAGVMFTMTEAGSFVNFIGSLEPGHLNKDKFPFFPSGLKCGSDQDLDDFFCVIQHVLRANADS